MIKAVNFQYSNDITTINKEQFEAHILVYNGYVEKINESDGILKVKGRSKFN